MGLEQGGAGPNRNLRDGGLIPSVTHKHHSTQDTDTKVGLCLEDLTTLKKEAGQTQDSQEIAANIQLKKDTQSGKTQGHYEGFVCLRWFFKGKAHGKKPFHKPVNKGKREFPGDSAWHLVDAQ